jgi:hypothetical protein
MLSMKDIIDRLKKDQILVGCTQLEIEKLELAFNVKLPAMYKEFLTAMGKSAGKFMLGSSAFWDEVFNFQEWGKELLAENNFKHLPQNAFVFWLHQGYQMAFFIIGEGDNPPVYYFSEGSNQTDFKKVESLTDFFLIQLKMSGIEFRY